VGKLVTSSALSYPNDSLRRQSGINMVDLMMWIVIAAILLAASIQGIGYYREAVILYHLKNDAMGAAANVKSNAAQNQGEINQLVVDGGLSNTNWSDGTTHLGKSNSPSVYSITLGNPEITKSVVYCSEDGISVVDNTNLPSVICGGTAVAGPPVDGGTGGTTTTTGILAEWGNDDRDQLGLGPLPDPTKTIFATPINLAPGGLLEGKVVTDVGSSGSHSCAVADGEVYCWGWGDYGQLGDGNTAMTVSRPVKVVGLSGKTITSLTVAGRSTCVLADGTPYCWGDNGWGQLGNGTSDNSAVPVPVDTTGDLSGKTVKKIVQGDAAGCALDTTNGVYCWGNGYDGEVGSGIAEGPLSPKLISGSGALAGKTITDIAITGQLSCAIADGAPYCWGPNWDAQIDSTYNEILSPVPVAMTGDAAGKTFTSITTSWKDACAIATDKNVYCWGNGSYGELGNGTTSTYYTPQKAVLPGPAVSIGSGLNHMCALLASGAMYCWGAGDEGQLGTGRSGSANSINSTPAAVDTSGALSGKNIISIGVGGTASFAIYK